MWSDFYVVSWVLVASLLLVCFITGSVFLRLIGFRSKNLFLDIFTSNLVGCACLVSGWAVFQVHFKTIFIVSMPLFLGLIFLAKSSKTLEQELPKQRFSFAHFFVLFLVLSGVVLFYVFQHYDGTAAIKTAKINEDQFYYSQLARYLTLAREENTFTTLNLLLPNTYNGTSLYHYFTPWLVNMVSAVSPLSSYFNLVVVVDAYYLFLVSMVTMGLAHMLLPQTSSVWLILFCPVWLFFGGFYTSLYGYLSIPSTFHFTLIGLSNSKLMVFYLFYFGAIVAFIHQHKLLALTLLLFLCLGYTQALPAIMLTLFILSLFLFKKEIRLQVNNWRQMLTLLSIFFLALILHLISSRTPGVVKEFNPYSLSFVMHFFEWKRDIPTMINILLGTSVNIFLLYLPCIFFLLFNIRQIINELDVRFSLLFTLVLGFASVSLWAFFFKDTNAVQLFFNVFPPFLNVFCFYFILKKYSLLSSNVKWLMLVTLGILCISNLYHLRQYLKKPELNLEADEFHRKLIALLPKDNSTLSGVELLGREDYKTRISVYQYHLLGDFLTLHNQDIQLVSLSDFYMNIPSSNKMDSLRNEAGFQEAFFHRYLHDRMKESNYPYKHLKNEHWKHQLQYIKDHDVSFAVLSQHYPFRDSIARVAKTRLTSPEGDEYVIF